jgi:hypothetical protein
VPALLPLLALAALPARAATVGSPVADTHAGRISVEALGGVARTTLRTADCEGEDGCVAAWKPVTIGGRLALALVPGLGLSGEYAWVRDTVRQVRYQGDGTRWSAGAHGSVGLGRGVRLGAVVTWEQGATATTGVEGGVTAEGSWQVLRASPLLAFAPEGGLATLWLGPTWRMEAEQRVWLAATDVESALAPDPAWGAVLGAEYRSDPLGPAWRGRTDRLVAGGEVRWEGGLGVDVRLGLAFW